MFLTFEGVDWSGKSTQAGLLAEWLRGSYETLESVGENPVVVCAEETHQW